MTVNQLIKKLYKLKQKIGPRTEVLIDWNTFVNIDHSHEHIMEIEFETIKWAIDGNSELANSNERLKRVITLKGGYEKIQVRSSCKS